MTLPRKGKNMRQTDKTIDRVDASKGYVRGNCVACCNAANQFKGLLESGNTIIDLENARKIIEAMEKSLKKG